MLIHVIFHFHFFDLFNIFKHVSTKLVSDGWLFGKLTALHRTAFSQIHTWSLNSQGDGIWRWGLWEMIGLDETMRVGPRNGIITTPIRTGRDTGVLSLRQMKTVKRPPPPSQEESIHQEVNWLVPWTSSYQNSDK